MQLPSIACLAEHRTAQTMQQRVHGNAKSIAPKGTQDGKINGGEVHMAAKGKGQRAWDDGR